MSWRFAPTISTANGLKRSVRDLSHNLRVGVRIGTVAEWTRWLEESGFEVEAVTGPGGASL
jgi:hypothetical protein